MVTCLTLPVLCQDGVYPKSMDLLFDCEFIFGSIDNYGYLRLSSSSLETDILFSYLQIVGCILVWFGFGVVFFFFFAVCFLFSHNVLVLHLADDEFAFVQRTRSCSVK